MKLVIDIDDDLYTRLFDNGKDNLIDMQEVCVAVRKGVIIPKGHGRLIDADELKKYKYYDNNRFENAIAVARIDWAETIIEADKSGSEE